jgi:hypothetical protein
MAQRARYLVSDHRGTEGAHLAVIGRAADGPNVVMRVSVLPALCDVPCLCIEESGRLPCHAAPSFSPRFDPLRAVVVQRHGVLWMVLPRGAWNIRHICVSALRTPLLSASVVRARAPRCPQRLGRCRNMNQVWPPPFIPTA